MVEKPNGWTVRGTPTHGRGDLKKALGRLRVQVVPRCFDGGESCEAEFAFDPRGLACLPSRIYELECALGLAPPDVSKVWLFGSERPIQAAC